MVIYNNLVIKFIKINSSYQRIIKSWCCHIWKWHSNIKEIEVRKHVFYALRVFLGHTNFFFAWGDVILQVNKGGRIKSLFQSWNCDLIV